MASFKIFKETALPGTLEPHAVYLIGQAADPSLLEIYVTDADASAPHRHVLNKVEVQAMIDATLGSNDILEITETIATRNALQPSLTDNTYVYVTNATGDPTVASGGATYLFNFGLQTWIKTSEAESMDVVLNWGNIVGKPASSAAAIDAAVIASHTHTNKTQLDLVGQNGSGEMTYNGVQVKTEWSSTAW